VVVPGYISPPTDRYGPLTLVLSALRRLDLSLKDHVAVSGVRGPLLHCRSASAGDTDSESPATHVHRGEQPLRGGCSLTWRKGNSALCHLLCGPGRFAVARLTQRDTSPTASKVMEYRREYVRPGHVSAPSPAGGPEVTLHWSFARTCRS